MTTTPTPNSHNCHGAVITVVAADASPDDRQDTTPRAAVRNRFEATPPRTARSAHEDEVEAHRARCRRPGPPELLLDRLL